VQKLERLLNLTAALLDAVRPLTAEEIHERVPGYPEAQASFRRQFERDKDALRALGIPLRLEAIAYSDPPADGYRIHKQEYQLRDPGLEPDELAALHLASSLLRLSGVAGDEALWKLGGSSAPAPVDAAAALPAPEPLAALFGALGERRPVAFRYRDVDRVVEPLTLHFSRGRWYLQAHDRTRGAQRSFRLDRIEGAVTVDEQHRFEARTIDPPEAAAAWEIGEDAPITATVRVDAELAGWAVRELGPDSIVEEASDGAVVLSIEVVNRPAFVSFVVGFLEHAEVLGPPELRQDVIDWLRGCVAGAPA
jgi:predicted DNA-binding transcriptional regulator YafY